MGGGQHLVVNLKAGGPQLLVHSPGVGGLNGVAEAVVRVGQKRGAAGGDNVLDGVAKLGQVQKAEVGLAQHAVGQSAPGEEEGGKAGLLGDAGGQAVVHAGQSQKFVLRQKPAEFLRVVVHGVCPPSFKVCRHFDGKEGERERCLWLSL